MSHTDKPIETSSWFEAQLTRRDAHKLGVGLAAVAALAGCDDEKVAELDSLDAQKKGGWDVGDTQMTLAFTNGVQSDSKGGTGFKAYKDPKKLLEATRPKTDAHKPWEMPTLMQSLEQLSLAQQMKPVSSAATLETYKKARSLGSLVTTVKEPEKTLMIVDLPGPHAVAAAAGMAEWVEPVFYFDNWPHPKGVVKSHETLGSLLYYAVELDEQKQKRSDKAPGALILDQDRLNPVTNPDTQFDNRYYALPPTVEDLKKAGVERVVYVTLDETTQESDDLNDFAVEYAEAGLEVTAMALSSIKQDPEHKPEPGKEDPTGGYYYGGSHATHTHFYTHYPVFLWVPMPMYGWAPATRVAPPPRPPAYKPARRATMFSNRTTGAARGVGRVKPTGFGRVSTRVDSSGRILGTRSGSVGRFRSSSSFGG